MLIFAEFKVFRGAYFANFARNQLHFERMGVSIVS